ncbi:MAG: hypothetical protein GOVbin630_200 [Prokaryotic dsDNA virus sp.]|nr:MAG: hypothetical protein GOVbin630_200 [Prokaryotic dsDNA virus sp.]
MSKKTLLNEATVRRFMKLAEIEPLASGFVNENYPPMADDDEAAEDAVPEDATSAEADWDEAEFEAGKKEAEEEMGDDLDVDLDMEDADPGELTLTDEEAEVFLKVADKVRAAMEAGGDIEDIPAPDMGGDEEIDVVDLDMEAPEMGDEDLDVEEEEVELEEESSDKWGHGKKEFKRHRDAAGKETETGVVGGGKYGKGGHYKDYEDDEDDLHEDKPYTAKKEKPGADKRKGAKKRGAEGTLAKTKGHGRVDYVNEDLVNEIAARIAKRVLQAKKK